MSSKYILYYSNTCEDCSRLLQLLSKTDEINLAIDFICIDERIKDAQNSYYVGGGRRKLCLYQNNNVRSVNDRCKQKI
jgi:hypothetical protein